MSGMLGKISIPLFTMADVDQLLFSSDTDLETLAAEHGYRYELSADGKEEFVIRSDGTIVIRNFRVPPELRGEKSKDPSVWMLSIRYHTYHGKPQDIGAIYLAQESDVENIINLKFAVRDTPPPTAVRRP
jgi:hypothetical protein